MSGRVRVWPLPLTHQRAVGTAVVVDLLRASTTITRALGAGAACVRPCLETGEALALRGAGVVLGGERGGVRIEGFDLGNSPAEYTRASVGGRVVVFTTTNGTRAIEAARRAVRGRASAVLVGCLNNLSAVVGLASGAAGVEVVCAGTGGVVTDDDLICAGAIAEHLVEAGFEAAGDEGTSGAIAAWRSARTDLAAALRRTRGGRNLVEIGLGGDVDDCAAINTCGVVGVLADDGTLRASP